MKYQVRIYLIKITTFPTLVKVIHDFDDFEKASKWVEQEREWRGDAYAYEIMIQF